MPHRVFHLDEVAEHLHLPKADVEELVRCREIPFERIGERLVFRRRAIEAWLSQRILGLSPAHLKTFHRHATVRDHDLSKGHALIPELLRPAGVDPALVSKTKASVLRDMTAVAAHTGLVIFPTDLAESLVRREQRCSTALAGGVAMLHPEHHDPYAFEDSFVALGRTVQRIPFGAPDGRTTDLFFLVGSQDDHIHLHLLSRLCTICFHTDALARLREAGDAEQMVAILAAAEQEVIRDAVAGQ